MNNLFKLICVVLLIASCGTSKKVKESKEHEKTTVKTEEIKKDSIVKEKELKIIKSDSIINITEILPTISEMEFDLNDIAKSEGDFKSTIKSGTGNEMTIEKKGSIIKITTKTSGSISTNISVTKSEINEIEKETNVKEENNNTSIETDKIKIEKRTVIRSLPWWFYPSISIFVMVLIYFFRKKIVGILFNLIPSLKTVKFLIKIIS